MIRSSQFHKFDHWNTFRFFWIRLCLLKLRLWFTVPYLFRYLWNKAKAVEDFTTESKLHLHYELNTVTEKQNLKQALHTHHINPIHNLPIKSPPLCYNTSTHLQTEKEITWRLWLHLCSLLFWSPMWRPNGPMKWAAPTSICASPPASLTWQVSSSPRPLPAATGWRNSEHWWRAQRRNVASRATALSRRRRTWRISRMMPSASSLPHAAPHSPSPSA